MAVTDQKLLPTSQVAIQTVDVIPTIAQTQAGRIIRALLVKHEFLLKETEVYARVVTANISFDIALLKADGALAGVAGLFAASAGANPITFKIGAHYFRVGNAVAYKAALATQAFSAAHVVNATKWGVILVQMTAAGVVSTKVPLSPQVYTSEAAALAAKPALTAGNIEVGTILIHAGVANWTANTDDLTPGSDLATVTFLEVEPTPLAATALVPVAQTSVYSAAPASRDAGHSFANGIIVLAYTADGTAVLTDAAVRLRYRPFPLNGES